MMIGRWRKKNECRILKNEGTYRKANRRISNNEYRMSKEGILSFYKNYIE